MLWQQTALNLSFITRKVYFVFELYIQHYLAGTSALIRVLG